MKFVLIAAISSAAWMHAAASGNLLSCETDFETTTEGWYGWNPCVPEPNCAEDGAVGSRSLEFRGSESLRSPFIWDALKPETHYTVSFFAKGDGGRLSVALVTTGWRWIGAQTVGLEPKWRRISYTFKTGASGVLGRAFCVEIKRIQPKARVFLMTIPRNPSEPPERTEYANKLTEAIYKFADAFEFTYVIDLQKYGPAYDDDFRRHFFLDGHMNAAGYQFHGRLAASYIDYIIRHNMDDFMQIGFVGTPYKNVNYKW
jgi:hypothetical protein